MNPGAFVYDWLDDRRRARGGVVWPLLIALLFAALSMISFAVDQSVTLSTLPELQGFDVSR